MPVAQQRRVVEVLSTIDRLVENEFGNRAPLTYVMVAVSQALYDDEDARHRAEMRAHSAAMQGVESSFIEVAGAQSRMRPYGDVLYVVIASERTHAESIAKALRDGYTPVED
jgi:hypothetical protein